MAAWEMLVVMMVVYEDSWRLGPGALVGRVAALEGAGVGACCRERVPAS